MKIIKLQAENFKRLQAVEITPEGNTVLITGKNGAGKSSVLDSIVAALCGKKYAPDKPIRDGEERAEIKIETENWIIKRTFTAAGGGSVTISNADGMKASSPQTLLDKVVGQIAFDPMLFITQYDARKQREVLMKLAGLDFSDIDKSIAEVKQQRSEVRRDKERFEHEANAITVPEGTPDEEVSVVELSQELQKANEANHSVIELEQALVARQERLVGQQGDIANCKINIERLEKELAETKEALQEYEQIHKKAHDAINTIQTKLTETEKVDTDAIQQKIANAEEVNVNVRLKKQKANLKLNVTEKTAKYSELGKKMKDLEQSKATRLAEAEMPLEGLSVDEDGVIYDGIPLSQVNDAKKLEVGMGIAMAENPELRVIRMNGNDLDDDSLEIIRKLAMDKDFQVWIERWAGGPRGIIIEDGNVKGAEVKPEPVEETIETESDDDSLF